MSGPRAKPVTVSTREAQVLNQILRPPTQAQGLVSRSKIIRGAAVGESISPQRRELGRVRKAVPHWREKWESQREARQAGEEGGAVTELSRQVVQED